MDEHEIAQRIKALPSQFQSRLSASSYDTVHLDATVGEWAEALENLIAALRKTNTAITADERQELTELLTALDMPTDQLDQLTVH